MHFRKTIDHVKVAMFSYGKSLGKFMTPQEFIDKWRNVYLKERTLTNLYNARPTWLEHAHKALDEVVTKAYGWGDDWRSGALTEDEILSRLFQLNLSRAAAQTKGAKP
jgi:hypothetical protein